MNHDPRRIANLLREILANDKTKVGFFLGAGCPYSIKVTRNNNKEGLVPDISGLTESVQSDLLNNNPDLFAKFIAYLASVDTQKTNVEEWLSRVRWLIDVVGRINAFDLGASELKYLEALICQSIATKVRVDLPNQRNGYDSIAAWIKGFERSKSVEIFTTNYDLLMEQALEESKITFFDGFTGAKKPFFDVSAIERDQLPPFWTRLWKLHGSINWEEDIDAFCVRRITGATEGVNSLIHPSHKKYDQSRRLPYLALLDQLRKFIRVPSSALLVSGYSFRDQHLNELMLDGLEHNPTATCILMMFGTLDDYRDLIRIAEKRPNLIVLCNDGGVFGTRSGGWESVKGQDTISLKYAFSKVDEHSAEEAYYCSLGDFSYYGEFLLDVAGTALPEKGVGRA